MTRPEGPWELSPVKRPPDWAKFFLLPCVRRILSLLQSYVLFTAETQGSAKPPPWVCVVFEGGFGPKALGTQPRL
jgi:hypothetical protein